MRISSATHQRPGASAPSTRSSRWATRWFTAFCGSSISRTATSSCSARSPGFISRPKSPPFLPTPSIVGGARRHGAVDGHLRGPRDRDRTARLPPVAQRPKLTVLITAIGVSLFIEYTCQNSHVFGAAPKSFPDADPRLHRITLGGLSLNSNQIIVLVVTAAACCSRCGSSC